MTTRIDTYSTMTSSFAIVTTDLNNDTYLDIVATNYGSASISVFRGYGNGTFAPQVTFPVGSNPDGIAIGDLNGDNRLDIVVANDGSSTISVLLGYGNLSFAS